MSLSRGKMPEPVLRGLEETRRSAGSPFLGSVPGDATFILQDVSKLTQLLWGPASTSCVA